MRKNKLKILCILASAALFMQTAPAGASALNESGAADDAGADDEVLSENFDLNVIIDTAKNRKRISRYIYGINNTYGIGGVTAKAVKQSGAELSSYNWETNTVNLTDANNFRNTNLIVSAANLTRWEEPALLTDMLMLEAAEAAVPSKYVTLQMMGYAAGDAGGNVSEGDMSRWNEVRPKKGGDLFIQPDTADNMVYMDEYASFLVNTYGYAADGGINGYFLDYEPENWVDRYSVLGLKDLTAKGLLSKSVSLAGSVKKIDPTALVYGPSVGGIESYVNLKNPLDWEQYKNNYSWFIDYYLDTMRAASEQEGTRLLDVLDLHYISEAKSVILEPIIGSDSDYANQERMQAVRILWDSNYTENSTAAILYKQHTPVIPTLQASIRMYYPKTKLSFSEYNFGGGNHISGGIAEADALGIFGEQDVYMACLAPDRREFPYQKSGINIYTNYDGEGSSYGNVSVFTSYGGDNMTSVHASVKENSDAELTAIFMNKSTTDEKTVHAAINSDVDFSEARIFYFDEESSDIRLSDTEIRIKDNTFDFVMSPLTVYLFELCSSDYVSSVTQTAAGASGETEMTADTDHEHVDADPIRLTARTTSESEATTSVSVIGTDNDGSEITEIITETSAPPKETEGTGEAPPGEKEEAEIPKFVKITALSLVGAVAIAMLLVLFSDNKRPGKK